MPSLGNAYYPTITVTEAVAAATAVERDFRGSITIAGLASHMGMTERGGAFRHKVTALHRYGLFDGRGTLSVTSVGQRAAHPDSPAEHDLAVAEAFLNVDLFRRLHERFGDDLPAEAQLRIVLEELTGADRRDVASILTRIGRLYADGLEYVQPSSLPRPSAEPGLTGGVPYEETTLQGQQVEKAPQGQIVITDHVDRNSFDRSLKGIVLLRMYVDLLERKIRLETNEEESGDDVE